MGLSTRVDGPDLQVYPVFSCCPARPHSPLLGTGGTSSTRVDEQACVFVIALPGEILTSAICAAGISLSWDRPLPTIKRAQ